MGESTLGEIISLRFLIGILLGFSFVGGGCVWNHARSLDNFSSQQDKKVEHKTVYLEANLDFRASVYEPSYEDIEGLREAWKQYGEAFPQSKPISNLSSELSDSRHKV